MAAAPTLEKTPPRLGTFKPWCRGGLDLHHIATGRGNATFAICPDGTTLMVDAGAIYDPLTYTIAPKPDGARRPGEWVARYVQRHLAKTGGTGIDYLVATHFHSDHVGGWTSGLPKSATGDFELTGVTDVAEQLPIGILLDRGYPNYDYPPVSSDAVATAERLTVENYRKYVRHRIAHNQRTERFLPGKAAQIRLLREPERYPGFSVRNLAVNGEVWTGVGESTSLRFPECKTLPSERYPTENMCSAALRIQYGRFSYYTGGDLPNQAVGWYDDLPWQDIATPVAESAGPVSVAVANHHGYVDSMGAKCVSALRPRVFVIFGWDSAHPTITPLYIMQSRRIYPAERDVFVTAVKPENAIATRDLSRVASQNGHVVVRVPEQGDSFTVEILDNNDESDSVIATHGPYPCS